MDNKTPSFLLAGMDDHDKALTINVLEVFRQCGVEFLTLDFDSNNNLAFKTHNMDDRKAKIVFNRFCKQFSEV